MPKVKYVQKKLPPKVEYVQKKEEVIKKQNIVYQKKQLKAKIYKNPEYTIYENFTHSTDDPKRPFIWMQGDEEQYQVLKNFFQFLQSIKVSLPTKIKGFHRWTQNKQTDNYYCIYQKQGTWIPFDIKLNFPNCYFYTSLVKIQPQNYWQCLNGNWKHICPAIQILQKINKELKKTIMSKKNWKQICHLVHPDKIKYQITNNEYMEVFKQTQRLVLQSEKDDRQQTQNKILQKIKGWLEKYCQKKTNNLNNQKEKEDKIQISNEQN